MVKSVRYSSLNRLHKVLILSPILLLLTWTPVSDGRPFRLAKLPDGGANFGCGSCHIDPKGGGPRNAFGEDYNAIARPAGDVYTAELGQTDSDGDSFSNDEEFDANPPTEPWNADSHPPVEPGAVEPHRETFTVWARLKSLRSGRNFRFTTKETFPGLTKIRERKVPLVHRTNSAIIEYNASIVTVQPQALDKPSAKKMGRMYRPAFPSLSFSAEDTVQRTYKD